MCLHLLARGGARAAGLESRSSQESHISDKNRQVGDKGTGGALPHEAPGKVVCPGTDEILEGRGAPVVGHSKGTQGTGVISAGECLGRVRSLGEAELLSSLFESISNLSSSEIV